MREGDPEEIRKRYESRRKDRTLYGFFVTAVGFAILFWLPAPEWLKHATGWLVILFGGMNVDRSIVLDWFDLFGGSIPFFAGRSNDGSD